MPISRAALAVPIIAAMTQLTGCGGHGRFLDNETQTFVTLPATATVVIYSPSAAGERRPEDCAGAGGRVPLGLLGRPSPVPVPIRALAEPGADTLMIYADCPLSRGHAGAAAFEAERPQPCFARGAEPAEGYREIKACRRLHDIQRLVQEVRRNLPASRIFVAGSGVGGWAALLAARDPFRKFNAAIAIDPEIAGPSAGGQGWDEARARHLAWLAAARSLPALVIGGQGSGIEDLAAPDLRHGAPDGDPAMAMRDYIGCRRQDPGAPCAAPDAPMAPAS
jgi:pimeloyl-ACP methyl ester carboxylesterase